MLPLFRELARYGAIFIHAEHKRWWVCCEVSVPGAISKTYVRVSDKHLYNALNLLIPLAKKEYEEILRVVRGPQQSKITQYGTESDYKEIIY